MTQPLNYATKAMVDLLDHSCTGAPGTRAGLRYIADKLRQAEVFVLAEHGELLDRSKPRPEVPGLIFKPPFPVVALEYSAARKDWGQSQFTAAPSSKRIALAWDWQDDLPPMFKGIAPQISQPGVVVASVCYYDHHRTWMPIAAAAFFPYDGEYHAQTKPSLFRDQMIHEGRISHKMAGQRALESLPIPIMPEAIIGIIRDHGVEAMEDNIRADLMDELNAYMDLCTALACKNVTTVRHPAPRALNKARSRSSKPLLKDFHVLEIAGGGGLPGSGGGDGSSPRTHLRRGHIRRLAADRVTWVNATIVNGHGGFIDKQYSVRAAK